MYVYANSKYKTCQIVESSDILDAIAISDGSGIIYIADDSREPDISDNVQLNDQELNDLMNRSIAWKDGILTTLGKTLITDNNFRNYID